jgi:hypothetical protein
MVVETPSQSRPSRMVQLVLTFSLAVVKESLDVLLDNDLLELADGTGVQLQKTYARLAREN